MYNKSSYRPAPIVLSFPKFDGDLVCLECCQKVKSKSQQFRVLMNGREKTIAPQNHYNLDQNNQHIPYGKTACKRKYQGSIFIFVSDSFFLF